MQLPDDPYPVLEQVETVTSWRQEDWVFALERVAVDDEHGGALKRGGSSSSEGVSSGAKLWHVCQLVKARSRLCQRRRDLLPGANQIPSSQFEFSLTC